MKISELKEAIREMIVKELNEAETGQVSTDDPAKAEMLAKKGVNVELTEDDALMEMASLVQASKEARRQGKNQEADALETTEEKTIEQFKTAGISPNSEGRLKGFASQYKKNLKNDFNIDLQGLFNDLEAQAEKDGESFNASIAINSIEKTAANKLTGKEVGQRGRKADPSKPAKEKKESGMRGRPKSATPTVKKKEEKMKTFSMGDKKYYAGSEDEEGPSDLELRKLAGSGGKFEKGKAAQLRAQEKTKLVKSFLKDMRDAGIVDNANRVLDKDKYATEWSKAKIEIEDKVSKLK
jgi:hypothetical protein